MKHLYALLLASAIIPARLCALEVYVSPKASAPEKNAAVLLSKSLGRLSGAPVPVTNRFSGKETVLAGHSPEAASLSGIGDAAKLAPDEIVLEKHGSNYVVMGGRPRGTVYAAYEFLERCGMKFLSPSVTVMPEKGKFALPEGKLRYAPPFECREVHADSILNDPMFAVAMRCNGYFENIPAEWGGHVAALGFCHTFRQIVPPKRYFAAHPEWFAVRGGKRTPDAQPCLANAAFRAELARNACDWLRRNPGYAGISISQNDNELWCECPACTEFVKKHGSQTDLVIDAVNDAARKIRAEFPGRHIETLAYLYTRRPPKSVKPDPAVTVRLCSIESNPLRPLSAGENAAFAADAEGWKKLTTNLAFWYYAAYFANYRMIAPNLASGAKDIKWFRDLGAKQGFVQLAYLSGGISDLPELRTWVFAKLLWNPSLSVSELTAEFAGAYYGAAAPHIEKYIALMERTAAAKTPAPVVNCWLTSTGAWLDDPALLEAWKIMDSAVNAVKDDPVLRERAMLAAAPVRFAALERPKLFRKGAPLAGTDVPALVDSLFALAKRSGTRYFAEDTKEGAFAVVRQRLEQQHGLVSNDGDAPEAASGKHWFARAAASAKLFRKDVLCFVEKDPGSGIDQVVRIPCVNDQWIVQFPGVPQMKCEVYLEYRCTGESARGPAVTLGIYSASGRRTTFAKRLQAQKKYALVKAGETVIEPGSMIYAAPVINKSLGNLLVRRIVLVELPQ